MLVGLHRKKSPVLDTFRCLFYSTTLWCRSLYTLSHLVSSTLPDTNVANASGAEPH